MEKRLLSLLLWTALFYFVFGPIRDWGESGNFFYIYRWLVDYEYFLLFNTNLISFAGYSFGTYLVFFYTYPKKEYTLGVILFLLCIPVMIAFRYVLQEILMKAIFGFTNYTEGYSLYGYFFDNLYYAFVFTSFGVIVYFLRYSRTPLDILKKKRKIGRSLSRRKQKTCRHLRFLSKLQKIT